MGSITFNVFLCDLFLFKPNIDLVSYADDNTLFAISGSSELELINEIKSVVESLTLRFGNNCMKVNPDKFHLLFCRYAKMAAYTRSEQLDQSWKQIFRYLNHHPN